MLKLNKIYCMDCLEGMKQIDDNSVDTIITDPPYGLSFMGKKWDYDIPSVEIWEECLRVLKSGGTALIFAGSRTQHRVAVNIEDAGFILKDCIMWLYGSGFPKASDISKQLDKRKIKISPIEFGNLCKKKREKLRIGITKADKLITNGTNNYRVWIEKGKRLPNWEQYIKIKELYKLDNYYDDFIKEAEREVIGRPKDYCEGRENHNWCGKPLQWETKSSTPEAQLWNGWKSHGLKPAYEPIIVAMKPNEGSYANNALKHGVSGLNIDGGRISLNGEPNPTGSAKRIYVKNQYDANASYGDNKITPNLGRYPSNIILDEESAKVLDEQSGVTSITGKRKNTNKFSFASPLPLSGKTNRKETEYPNDIGGASRFFYVAKASKSERNMGCEKNKHPTVKPLKLMEYLCILTRTPTGGTVLDPFAGSGTTGLACKKTGRDYILIEKEPEYVKIAQARLNSIGGKQVML